MTADRAAAQGLRDAYAGANAAWLAEYNANRGFFISLQWTGGQDALERRNVAGAGWEDVTSVVAIPGEGLPLGSDVLTDIRWDAANAEWEAVSSETTIYMGLTRDVTLARVSAAVLYALDNGLQIYPPTADISVPAEEFSVSQRGASARWAENTQSAYINHVWPSGGPAPYVWVLTPAHTDWIDDFVTRYEDWSTGARVDRDFVLAVDRDEWRINGVPYDMASAQVPGARPPARTPGAPNRGYIPMWYVAPAVPSSSFVAIP